MTTLTDGFAVWITGLPASGKTALAIELSRVLHDNYNIRTIRLESDELRRFLTPTPNYSLAERNWFYSAVMNIARLISSQEVPVLIDATSNRRIYREEARRSIAKFMEVYVKCPLEVCMARDPKGIYARAQAAEKGTVPGLQEVYEEPEHPEVVVESDRVDAKEGAQMVLLKLHSLGWIHNI